jgi:quinoprotein glucose dehydrogenase
MPTADGRLIALDPESGAVCTGFGGGTGQIDLWAHMPNRNPGGYYSTSPVIVTRALIVVGGTVLDNVSTHETSGVVRAFDVDSGALVWNWDSGNPDATAPIAAGASYTANSPNSWSISSVDEKLGLVYVPLGNQPPDQWGGQRSAAVERYASSVVALELATGRVRWRFQTVHHDLWDYDVPAQPTLLNLTIDGQSVPALVQPTKQGELFVLDRRNGKPLLPVTETPAPQGASAGDRTAPTQPVSALSFDPPRLTGHDMWGATLFDQLACRIALRRLRYDGRYTPPTTQGSLIYPGNFGVFNWGGIAVDPQRQIAFATPTQLAFVSKLVPRANDTALYVQDAGPPKGSLPALNENFGAPFAVQLHPFTSPIGLPCQAPPWGYVAGADLDNGHIVWQHKNGTVRDRSPLPLPFRMGVPNLGGPIVTAGGVAFLSGTLDYFLRAYDVTSGRQLWEGRLPAGAQATPMTYRGADGRQYVLVVAGGHGSLGTKAGDYGIAYALPR